MEELDFEFDGRPNVSLRVMDLVSSSVLEMDAVLVSCFVTVDKSDCVEVGVLDVVKVGEAPSEEGLREAVCDPDLERDGLFVALSSSVNEKVDVSVSVQDLDELGECVGVTS